MNLGPGVTVAASARSRARPCVAGRAAAPRDGPRPLAGRDRSGPGGGPGAGDVLGRPRDRPAIEARARKGARGCRNDEGPGRPKRGPRMGHARHAPSLRRGRRPDHRRRDRGKESGAGRRGFAGSGSMRLQMEQLLDTIGEVLDDGTPRTRAELSVEVGARLGEQAGRAPPRKLGQRPEDRLGPNLPRPVGGRGERGTFRPRVTLASGLARRGSRGRARPARGPIPRRLRAGDPEGAPALVGPRHRVDDAARDRVARRCDQRGRRRRCTVPRANSGPGRHRVHPPDQGVVRFVGGFDPFIVGAGLREQLIPAAHLRRVSRTAGWISPVVLVDGVAAGVWDAVRSRDRLTVTIEPFSDLTARDVRASVERRRGRSVARTACPRSVRYGRGLPEKRSKAPFKDR